MIISRFGHQTNRMNHEYNRMTVFNKQLISTAYNILLISPNTERITLIIFFYNIFRTSKVQSSIHMIFNFKLLIEDHPMILQNVVENPAYWNWCLGEHSLCPCGTFLASFCWFKIYLPQCITSKFFSKTLKTKDRK